MAGTKGQYLGGIRTLADLKARCHVDDVTGCWNFRGSCSKSGQPMIWFAPLEKRVTPGVILYWLKTGERCSNQHVYFRTCESATCCNPAHRKAGTRRDQMIHLGYVPTPETRAKIARAFRARSPLTDESAEAIFQSADSQRVLAERYGVSQALVSQIRRGKVRRPQVRGSSIFNLGG